MDLDRIPSAVLVLESDPIAVEIANTLNVFGSRVYIATQNTRILPGKTMMPVNGSRSLSGNRALNCF